MYAGILPTYLYNQITMGKKIRKREIATNRKNNCVRPICEKSRGLH